MEIRTTHLRYGVRFKSIVCNKVYNKAVWCASRVLAIQALDYLVTNSEYDGSKQFQVSVLATFRASSKTVVSKTVVCKSVVITKRSSLLSITQIGAILMVVSR